MSNSDLHIEAEIFNNTPAPSTSAKYNITGFSHTCIIAKINSGQLDVEVSNDGNAFVIYESITSDGYSEPRGFGFVQLVASSGIILSAVLTAKRRYPILSMEVKASKRMYIYKKLDKTGWGKGDI